MSRSRKQTDGHDVSPEAPAGEQAEAVPDDLEAAALALRQASADAAEEEIRCRGEAGSIVAGSEAEAERVRREGHAKALPLIARADAAARKAAEDSGRSKRLQHAARQQVLAEEAEHQAADLTAELGRLTEVITGLDGRLAGLGADRERLEAERGEARTAGDVSRLADLRNQLDATSEAMTALTGQRETAQARARQIGDGTETGPGQLLDGLRAAERHRAALTATLDELYPGRPGAEHRRNLVRLKNALEGNMTRLAEEERKPGPRRYGFAGSH